MTQTKYKFKAGDLVQDRNKEYHSTYGIGIIIELRDPFLLFKAYNIFWTKKGLRCHYEHTIKKVSNDGTNKI